MITLRERSRVSNIRKSDAVEKCRRAGCMRFHSRLLRTLLGRNLRHVDLAIRTGTNVPLFYSLAFGQLTRLVPGDSLTSRASRAAFLRVFCVHSLRRKGVTAFIRTACPHEGFLPAMSRSRAASQYFVAIFRPQPVNPPSPVPFVDSRRDRLFLNEKNYTRSHYLTHIPLHCSATKKIMFISVLIIRSVILGTRLLNVPRDLRGILGKVLLAKNTARFMIIIFIFFLNTDRNGENEYGFKRAHDKIGKIEIPDVTAFTNSRTYPRLICVQLSRMICIQREPDSFISVASDNSVQKWIIGAADVFHLGTYIPPRMMSRVRPLQSIICRKSCSCSYVQLHASFSNNAKTKRGSIVDEWTLIIIFSRGNVLAEI